MKKEYLIYKLSDEVKNSCKIDTELFSKYGVKRGLRNDDGSGVLVGLTNIGNVVGYNRAEDGKLTPCPGKLYYRGYELDDLVAPLLKEKDLVLRRLHIFCFQENFLTKRNCRLLVNFSTIICLWIIVQSCIS